MGPEQMGYVTLEEIKENVGYPSEERFKKGPVAVAECIQLIPCNPCEAACKFGAIKIGTPITNRPKIDADKCVGCCMCISQCSGLAIFVLDKTYSETHGTVAMPYEYYPTPAVGQKLPAVNRQGEYLCVAEVVKVMNPKTFDRTPVVTLAVPLEHVDEVRSIQRKEKQEAMMLDKMHKGEEMDDDILVCRCEEITLGEIKAAMDDGARTVTGVKLRTRAGMGLCQGRTCEKMVQALLKERIGNSAEEIGASTSRPPVRPVTFGSLAGIKGGANDEEV